MKTKHSHDHPYKLYTDGGVIDKNPSPYGGTWACVLTLNDEKVWEHSGLLLPSKIYFPNQVVTNNQSELFAILKGLELLPIGATVTVCSDSNISLGRMFGTFTMNNIPTWMLGMRATQRNKFNHWHEFGYMLMNGHPTKAELEAGIGKRGYPTSKWNVLCDKLCQDQAKKYMRELNEYSKS